MKANLESASFSLVCVCLCVCVSVCVGVRMFGWVGGWLCALVCVCVEPTLKCVSVNVLGRRGGTVRLFKISSFTCLRPQRRRRRGGGGEKKLSYFTAQVDTLHGIISVGRQRKKMLQDVEEEKRSWP